MEFLQLEEKLRPEVNKLYNLGLYDILEQLINSESKLVIPVDNYYDIINGCSLLQGIVPLEIETIENYSKALKKYNKNSAKEKNIIKYLRDIIKRRRQYLCSEQHNIVSLMLDSLEMKYMELKINEIQHCMKSTLDLIRNSLNKSNDNYTRANCRYELDKVERLIKNVKTVRLRFYTLYSEYKLIIKWFYSVYDSLMKALSSVLDNDNWILNECERLKLIKEDVEAIELSLPRFGKKINKYKNVIEGFTLELKKMRHLFKAPYAFINEHQAKTQDIIDFLEQEMAEASKTTQKI